MIPEEANEEEEGKEEEIKGVSSGEADEGLADPETPIIASNADLSDEDDTQ